VRLGTEVFALANLGDRRRVTVGFVSAVNHAFRGPPHHRQRRAHRASRPRLLGRAGGDRRLLGMNTNRPGDGFYLAIPAHAALRRRLDALARGESPARPRLGVGIAPAPVARRLRSAVGLPGAGRPAGTGVRGRQPCRAGLGCGSAI
jgi:hypothetical protein